SRRQESRARCGAGVSRLWPRHHRAARRCGLPLGAHRDEVSPRFPGRRPRRGGCRSMRIHVTGASGFIGTALTNALSSAGHTLAPGIASCDAVVHLAAIAHRRARREDTERVNVGLTRQAGQAAAAAGVPFVFLSSIKVHGELSTAPLTENSPFAPRDVYGESKVRAEDALRAIPGLRLAVL